MRRIGPLLMSTVLVTGCAGLATNNESVRSILERSAQAQPKISAYNQGKRRLQFGQAGLAIQAFEEALKSNPNSVPVLNGLAIAYDRLGRGDVSQRYLDQALRLDPDSVVTLNNLAYLNLVQGNTAVAQAYAERAKMAAALPMDMMLPETIANAVDRNADIAAQIATNEKQERLVAQAPAMPPERDIKRVGTNEWQLRIRPPNPADTVRINLPVTNATPRVIEPMMAPVITPMAVEPLTAAVVASGVPDSVMADLAPPVGNAPAETASLPQAPVSDLAPIALPVSQDAAAPSEPEFPRSVSSEPMAAPASVIPEPVIAALIEPPALASTPIPTAPIVVTLPEPESAPVVEPVVALVDTSPQVPEPVPLHDDPVVAASPAIQPPRTFIVPTPEALATVLPVLPVIPPMPLPEPAREEPMVLALAAIEPPQTVVAPQQDPVATVLPVVPELPLQQLPEPAREELIVAELPAPEPMPVVVAPAPEVLPTSQELPAPPPQQSPEPMREELVVASLPAPEPTPVLLTSVPELTPMPQALPAMPPQQLPEPVSEKPVVGTVSQPEPVEPLQLQMLIAPAYPVPASRDETPSVTEATSRLKSVVASLAASPAQPVLPLAPQPEPPKQVASAAAPMPVTPPAQPMLASLPPSQTTAPRAAEPAALKSDWRALVPASTDIRVSNGTGRRLMAGRFAGYFRDHGLAVRKIANANSFDYRHTVIFYNPDQRTNAEALAAVLPFPVRLAEAKQGHGQIELVLGSDLLEIDDALRSA